MLQDSQELFSEPGSRFVRAELQQFCTCGFSSVLAGFASKRLLSGAGYAGFAFFMFQAFMANTKVKKFDKTQAKFVQTKFNGEDEE